MVVLAHMERRHPAGTVHLSLAAAAAVLLLAFSPTTESLHCLAHGHCGEHAVCTTSAEHAVPRCRCLLGYTGNGQTCAPDQGLQQAAQAAVERSVDGRRRVVVEKCSGGDQPPPPTVQPVEHDHHPIVADSTLDVTVLGRRSACLKAACDFDQDECAFRNDHHGHWQRVNIGQGNLVAAVSSAGSHYLASPHFILSRPALIRFDYFAASGADGRLALYSRSLSALVWSSRDDRDSWRTGVALLGAGRHQLIFAAEELSAGQLMALDNVVLLDSNGGVALCE